MAANSSLRSSSIFLILILSSILSTGSSTCTFINYAFSIKEATIKDIKLAFERNQLSSRQLVEFYIGEIVRLNGLLKGVIEVNPDALLQADDADKERKYKVHGSLPDLHGIPILLKDNIATKDRLNTTAGSFALLGSVVPRDAGVVEKLRKAGAIILGKASLNEWANFRSVNAPSGFSPRGGQGKNPYVLSATPCGSSSGSAISVAANLETVSLGTETDGSLLCPASFNSVVGLKPTVGLTSRAGVIPITPRQDTIGREGAVVVDNLQLANVDIILNFTISGEAVSTLAEFKLSLNAYLKELVASPELTEKLGQDIFLAAEATNGIGAQEKAALSNLENLSKNGLEKLMRDYKLDALVTPRSDASPVYAIGGFPSIIVPAGYDSQGVPIGISFGGLKSSEPKLIEISYAFEQATKIRKPPSFKP
ncbi:hypothetical protein CRYUN_Cryun18bG0116500 [Craigia yunnanensis]